MKNLLLALSLATGLLLGGCTSTVVKTEYVSVPVACPVADVSSFEPEIPSKSFTARKVNGNIVLSSDEFIKLTTHMTEGRTSYNLLMKHINEFNDLVITKNGEIDSNK